MTVKRRSVGTPPANTGWSTIRRSRRPGIMFDRRNTALASLTDFVGTPPAWHEEAECYDLAPAEADRLFFFEGGSPPGEAKQMCARCPVRALCLEAGDGELGMWGGLATRQRARGDLFLGGLAS